MISLGQSWAQYDRGPRGIAARLAVTNVRAVPLGTSGMVGISFERMLSCNSSAISPWHWFTERALQTMVWKLPSASGKSPMLVQSMTVKDFALPTAASKVWARNLDYTAVPTPSLSVLESFYSSAVHMGTPYKDVS